MICNMWSCGFHIYNTYSLHFGPYFLDSQLHTCGPSLHLKPQKLSQQSLSPVESTHVSRLLDLQHGLCWSTREGRTQRSTCPVIIIEAQGPSNTGQLYELWLMILQKQMLEKGVEKWSLWGFWVFLHKLHENCWTLETLLIRFQSTSSYSFPYMFPSLPKSPVAPKPACYPVLKNHVKSLCFAASHHHRPPWIGALQQYSGSSSLDWCPHPTWYQCRVSQCSSNKCCLSRSGRWCAKIAILKVFVENNWQ